VREIPLEGKEPEEILNGKLTGKPAFQDLIPELYIMGKLKGSGRFFHRKLET